ncbi:MAG: sulfite oxidase [Pseudomonadota bacterium]
MSTKNRIERGLHELYRNDPIRADWMVFGRKSYPDRRGFLRGLGLASMGAVLGTAIPFHRSMPAGLIPAALADDAKPFAIEGKDGLVVLNDRPLNAETPPHLLDDPITPVARHFIRNNGLPPENVDASSWSLDIDGFVETPMQLTIEDLKNQFETVTLALQLECGGNGRAYFDPPASGNQWTYGAVACAEWTGVRLAEVLTAAGVKPEAVYTAHYGADTHLSGDPDKSPISRGVPIEKAMDPNNLIAFAQNGGDIHPQNGAPLRLIVPGWPGSCSQKWLTRIELRDQVHDGAKMTGTSYRVPDYPVQPGAEVPNEDFVIIHSMPVKSLITFPETGANWDLGQPLTLRGHAWAGDRTVTALDLSHDFGATWQTMNLAEPANPYAWQNFEGQLTLPIHGYYELWARATDDQGHTQPFAIDWNPKGYLNNSLHRVAVIAS